MKTLLALARNDDLFSKMREAPHEEKPSEWKRNINAER